MTTRPVDEIAVGERDRTDLGDVAELARSIEAVGLLHPIVITEDGTLVAGDRRLAAVRHLGWTEVAVTVVDLSTAADVLRAEADENTCRKPLTPYEASRARERRAKVLADDAVMRHREGSARGGKAEGGPKLERPSTATRTRKLGAIGTGYSGSTLDKVDKIRDVAERGVVRQGKKEVPVPEPVREVATRVLEDVKQTGAAVDRSAKELDAAVAAYVDDDVDVKRARLRKALIQKLKSAAELSDLSPEHVAAAIDDEDWQLILHARDRISRWTRDVDAARPRGLHVIGGSK